MTGGMRTAVAVVAVAVATTVGILFFAVPRWFRTPAAPATIAAPAEAVATPEARKIKARLFYVAEDGWHLSAVEQDVVYAQDTVEQARAIVTAQLATPPEPLVSAIPANTALKALYLTPKGEAYVDLSQDVMQHPGGSNSEMLTVFTVVHALTVNLPAIKSVQILVDGKEVETLAGHLDLRRPLEKRLSLVLE
jgi:spore germination protein GerM